MWQYTTETIINSNVGNLEKVDGTKVRFAAFKYDGDKVADVTAGETNGEYLVIDGVNTFKTANIIKVYGTKYADEVKEKITIPAWTASVTAGEPIRLKVVLRQQGLVSSIYQNAYLKHNKPIYVEIASTGTKETDAENLAKAVKKQLEMSDFKFFTATASSGAITLEAADCYVRFVEAQVAKAGHAAGTVTGEALLGYEDYTVLNAWDGKTYAANGSEGMGTVRQLIKNLRIPTGASVNPFGADQGGKPIPGGKYNQYLIEYETNRRHVGGQVMGALDRSITSHVFFVESSVVADFEAALKAVGHTVTASEPTAPTSPKETIGSVE